MPAKKRKNGTRMGAEIIEAMEEMLRYFRGEPNGVKVTRVKLTPTILAIRELIDARKAAGMSKAEVAAAAGLSAAWVGRLEHGQVKAPTVDALARYARAVGRELRLSVEPTPAVKS
jgi:ribosome-binding protein aMBF1 (putative translation factor)